MLVTRAYPPARRPRVAKYDFFVTPSIRQYAVGRDMMLGKLDKLQEIDIQKTNFGSMCPSNQTLAVLAALACNYRYRG